MVLYPRLTLLDLAGPYEVFSRIPNTRVRLMAASLDPIRTDQGMEVLPDTPFEEAPQSEVLFVPGGPGQYYRMEDKSFLDFLRKQAAGAKWVTSVCTGSLLLGAAGLLKGYKATTHWMSMDLLEMLGAKPVAERVVVDRNRITGAGVTAGIDVALVIAAHTAGDDVAREVQLNIEYDPHPPFHSGSPRTADPKLVERVAEARRGFQEKRREQIRNLKHA
jgi:cyclohexyl-isocyanide hydratase